MTRLNLRKKRKRNNKKMEVQRMSKKTGTSLGWDLGEAVDSNCIDSCTELETEHTINISFEARQKITELVAAYPRLEWAVGLIGKQDGEKWIVDDIFVPEQEVHSCSVELTDEGNKELAGVKCIGWMHSHNDMKAFHSPKDDSNSKMFGISVTVNNKLETDARVKVQLPCGRFGMAKANVVFDMPASKGGSFVESIKDKIKEITWVGYNNGYTQYGYATKYNGPSMVCGVCLQQLSYRKSKTVLCRICLQNVHKACMSDEPEVCQECADRKGKAEGFSEWTEDGVEWEGAGYA